MNNFQVDRRTWGELNILEQMGNIGSEVGRTIKANEAGNILRFNSALTRCLDLFEATIDVLIGQKSGRVHEVLVAREQFLNLFFGDAPKGDDVRVERYFMQFAIAARHNR